MTAINRPIDILLNTEVATVRSVERGGELTDSNKRENSFDSLLSVKRKEARKKEPGERETQPAATEPKARHDEPPHKERQAVADKDGQPKTENGKALPLEKVDKRQGDEQNTEVNEEFLDLQVVSGETESTELLAEAVAVSTEQDGQPAKTDNETDLPIITGNLTLPADAEKATLNTVTLNSGTQMNASAQTAQTFAAAFNGLQQGAERKMSGELVSDKLKPGFELNLRSQIKLDVSDNIQTKELSLGQELKQWLNDNKSMPEVARPGAVSTGSQDSTINSLGPKMNALANATQGLTALRSSGVSLSVPVAVNSPNWGQVVAQRIAWLASNGIQSAELQLNPPELGPVEVKINVSSDQTNINFSSQHASIREALELSVHRLREMLESNGLNLADVNVSDQSLAREDEAGEDSPKNSGLVGNDSGDDAEMQNTVIKESASLVDFYA